jgi:hypothetical protein
MVRVGNVVSSESSEGAESQGSAAPKNQSGDKRFITVMGSNRGIDNFLPLDYRGLPNQSSQECT